ncbi:MAG: peptidase domain-containing ABC transporter [Deltaproteobacteria bacterium]|nr:peptidase domain-containing ABC transporter [Deltaproteobacteria bacterium]
MDIRDLSNFIRKIPLFAIYSDDDLAELMLTAELKSVKAGELIFEQGETGETFYIVYSGKIRILQKNIEDKEVNLGVRTSGDHFGETALITEETRNASARVVEDSVLIVIGRDAFHDYFFTRPELREYFDKFIKYTSIHQFLKTCTDLTIASPKDLQDLTQHFHSEFFEKGDVIFRQGAKPDKFYLIERGKLKVVRWEGKEQEVINFLREGDFFGEKALIEDTERNADIICLTDCHLFSLRKEDFNSLVQKSPKIKKVIEERIQTYVSDMPPIPYNEIIRQELSALKGIRVREDVSEGDVSIPKEKKRRLKKLSSLYHRHVRFPFIEQYDQMTCGTTCIMMIAKYYGKTFSSARLRELAHVDLSGSSMANLASAAEQLGFTTRGMKLDYQTLMSVHLPCIAYWQGYHYIVIYKMTNQYVWAADPALGLRRYTRGYFIENWNGITLILEPTPEFEKQTEDRSSIRRFFQFVTPYKKILLEIFLASLLLNIFGLATPIFTQNIVDKVLTHQNISMLNMMMIGMLTVLVFRVLTLIIRQYLIIHTSMKIDLRMLVAFYKHMLALPLGFFKVRKIGDFITRFGENLKIRNFLTNTALTIVLDTILIVVYLSLMFYYSRELTVAAVLFIPVFILLTLIFTPILKRLNVDSFTARAESQSHLIESINAIDTVKAMNIEYPTRWKWEDKFIKSLNIDFRLFNTAMYFHSIGDFTATLSSTFILWYGAHKVLQGAMSVGELMAFMALTGSVITPINRIITAWDNIQETLVSVNRLDDIFSAKAEFPESMEQETGLIIQEPKGEIVFEEVFFRYGGEDDQYILSNLNFKIHAGSTVAIVGRSGSGKTTLVRLIARFYDVTEGKIKIDGIDIKSINLSNLRKLVGFVLQENFIFNGTIRENISLSDPEETLEKVFGAAKLANAHEFITNLGLGYETRVGESGLQLSGGQKQRIAIARVLYQRPKVIIFDEATSSLDTESEQAIQKNLNAILKEKTAIIIAHRLSTVRNADMIIVLDDGEIVEQGTHEELMERKGLYHYLNYQQLNI